MNKHYLRVLFPALFIFMSLEPVSAQVLINEYSASNLTQFADNYGAYEDWIELYNPSSGSISIGGYYLSDDSLNNTRYQIPAGVTLSGFGYARFWTSGRNTFSGTHYHTNFKLTQTKNNPEFVVLSNPSGTIIDYVKITQKTQLGHSYGRTFNGVPVWSIFISPTPNASNNTATPYADYADRPDVSIPAGFYPGPVSVSLTTTEPNADIHYTIDGTLPTVTSPIYISPVTVNATTVIKAITYSADPEILPSFIEFETYFINESHTTVVVSITGTQLNTLANGTGWLEPKGSFEYFDMAGLRVAKTYGEFNRHGQDSWAHSHRSLDFISRDEMGYNHSIEEKMFALSVRDNFQRIILRAAGDDNYPADHSPPNLGSAHIRDAYIHNMAKIGGMNLDVRISEKCVVYLNGMYWGVYDLRENPDDHDFTNFHYGQDKYHLQYIKTWGNTWAAYGGAQALTDWNNFYNYTMGNNMNDPLVWQYVNDRFDVTSLTDYVLVNMFTVCSDWLNYNTGWWRGMDSTGTHLKWGYILWDNDATFGHYINYTGIPNTSPTALPCDVEGLSGNSDPEGHIDLLNKLRTNPDFNQYYIGRQIDMWNTVFSCDNMINQLDSITAILDPEMPGQANRWAGTYTEWQNNVTDLRNFILARCNNISNGFISCYSLNGPHDVIFNTDPVGAGSLKVNSLTINQFPWSAKYFGGLATKLQALPTATYTFDNWSANTQIFIPSDTSINADIDFTAADSIVAHFSLTTSILEPAEVGILPAISVTPTVINNNASVLIDLPENLPVTLNLYSVLGSELIQIIKPGQQLQKGIYSLELNLSGANLKSGVYFIDFTAGKHRQNVKLIYAPTE